MRLARLLALLWAATGWQAFAQWDTSGNGMLNGTYYFREVAYFFSSTGALSPDAIYGTIVFNGNGAYSINCTVYDSTYGLVSCGSTGFGLPTTGTYSIAASGYGFLSSPISGSDRVYGLVSQQGIFVGSSTENGFNDLFIAAPLASPLPTAATFKGSYWLADMDTPNGINSMFQVNPDGAGNLGNVSLTGYVYGYGSTVVTQTAAAVKYSFSGGAAVVAFPSPSNATLIAGQKYLYFSPDGNFVFGGSPTGWDFLVGIRTASGTPGFGGLYYQAGIDLSSTFDSYYGSLNANGGVAVGHQRVNDVLDGYLYGWTYGEAYAVNPNGTYSNPAMMNYVVGADGVRIGSGIGPYLGINVALPAPSFSGSGVYLNPAGVVNAASSAPFTAGIAPGDFITLYGTNLAPGTATAYTVPFPTAAGLDGVQVTVNGLPAPVEFVSPGQISAIVPYAVGSSIARIQVNNNGVLSNVVTEFVNLTAPGVFTVPPGGLGYGAVLHGDYSLVTAQSPAQVGETVAVYLTGLGTTNPVIPDGSAGVFSQTNNTIDVYIGGIQATVGYSGLAPDLAGLYQINFTVPSGVTAGDNTLEIVGPDSDAAEALIPVGTGLAASASPARQQPAVRNSPRSSPWVRRPMPRLAPGQ
ncbi:MAG: IPT/TIG domain-containing protein [Bryobacteraceae bacterium]